MAIDERAKAVVDVDGRQAGQELKKLEERAKELRNELVKLGKDNDLAGFRQREKELKMVNSSMRQLKSSTEATDKTLRNLSGASLNELTRAQRNLNAEIKASPRHTKEEVAAYQEKIQKLKQVNSEITKVKSESNMAAKAQGTWLSNATSKFNKYFGVIAAGMATFTGIVFSVKSLIQGNVELDDSLADVRKTTGLTQKEVRELYKEFNTLNTRTPKKELLELAEEAGRLGIEGKKNILGFVEVANQIKVALGDDLGGNASEAIKEVGKLTEIYKVGEKYGVDFKESMMMVGSSINEVSASSAADAPYLIDLTKRLAGVSSQAGIGVQDIIGYAAALDEMGQTSEVSATTLNGIIVNMFKDTTSYAKIAGMGLNEFSTMLNTDANEALIKVLEGLNGNNAGLTQMAKKLDGLGLDGARSTQVLAALASNIDLVRKNQTLANDSLEKGTSLTNEYQVKNNNMAGGLEKIGQAIKGAFINSGVNEVLTKIVSTVAKWVEIPVSQTMEDQRVKVNALAIELTDANTQEQRRKDIYEELKSISPDIVEGLQLEALNVDTLRGNLAKYNEEQIKKIALQKISENKKELEIKYGQAIAVTTEKEDVVRQKLVTLQAQAVKYDAERASEIDKILFSNISILDKEEKIQEIVKDINKEQGLNVLNGTYAANAAFEARQAKEAELELEKEKNKEAEAYLEKYKNLFGYAEEYGKGDWFNFGMGDGSSLGDIKKPIPDTADKDKGKEKKDKEAEKLKELLKQQEEYRLSIIQSGMSLIEQENIEYEKRLNDADVFDEKKRNSSAQHQQAFKVLEQQHLENIAKIHDKAFSEELTKNEELFEQATALRQTKHNNELAVLGTNEKEKEKLDKKFKEEEIDRQLQHLDQLMGQLQDALGGEDVFPDIDESLLSEQEKEVIKARLIELGLAYSDLMATKAGQGEEATKTGFQKFVGDDKSKVDLFGMSMQDWEGMLKNLESGNILLDDMKAIIGSMVEAWSMVNEIRANQEEKALQDYETNINARKDLLASQLEHGKISQEEYNSRVAAMDDDLDKKKKDIAIKQAKREKALSLVSAIVNTAVAVVKALGTMPPWLGIALAAVAGLMGGLQIAKIASTPIPQYATGYYDVIGSRDGKKYNAPVIDSPGTGLVNSPAILVGEKPEIIIDPYTTRNLQINYPDVINAINAARMPQFASGSYPSGAGTTKETISEQRLPREFYETMAGLKNVLQTMTEKGVQAKLLADSDYIKNHNEIARDYQTLRDQVSLKS